jgi:hypothetical protein
MPLGAIFLAWIAMAAVTVAQANGPPSLAWEQEKTSRRLPVQPTGGAPGFSRLDAGQAGILWTNQCSPARYSRRQNLLNGSGVAMADYDQDGWCDIYLCNREGANALFRNLGNWRFTNVTEQAGVAATHLISSGAMFADLNNDGHLDLHVTSFLGPDALYLNRGDGTFTNATASAGVTTTGGATSSAAADLDGDGDLDLYVARFAVEAYLRDGSVLTTRLVGGKPVVTGRAGRRIKIINHRIYENGEPDSLFLNQGDGHFSSASWNAHFRDESGAPLSEAPGDLGFAVQLRDINADGAPDIYVCNDFQTPDRCWLNDGTGRFRALSSTALRSISEASMGVDFADIDRDGHLDFHTVEMLPVDHFRHLTHLMRVADPHLRRPRETYLRDSFARSVLCRNRGDGTYAEIAWYAGVAASDWSWSPVFLDVDLDGYEDLLISSGYPHDVNHLDLAGGFGRGDGRRLDEAYQDKLLSYPPLDSPFLAWRNRGDLTFEDHSEAWRFSFRVVGHSMAFGDLDNDGDMDVVINAFQQPPVLCRNDSSAPRIAVRLHGRDSNVFGTGAQIRVMGGPVPVQEQEMLSGGRYLAGDQYQRTFSGQSSGELSIEVRWRDGSVTTVANAKPNSIYEVHQAHATPSILEAPARKPPLTGFQELPVPAELTHHEAPFDDLARQSLLPWRQCFQGPGLAWYDWDRDGTDDLMLGNGRGGHIRRVTFAPGEAHLQLKAEPFPDALPDDALGLLGLSYDARRHLLVAVSNYESDSASGSLRQYAFGAGRWSPAETFSLKHGPGSLAAGDVDADGDIDVIAAGRMIPERYPEAADTFLLRNENGRYSLDHGASTDLARVGMVTGALLADLTGDLRPELVLSCEWDPVKIFSWEGERFVNRTADLGLEKLTGIWQGVVAADFDADGRLDLAVANWGRNSFHQRAPEGPWQLFHADVDNDGRVSIVESYFHAERRTNVPFRHRDVLKDELPWLPALFPLHADYARASCEQVMGSYAAQFKKVEAVTLASVVLLNRGDHFELRELPREAQWTPIFGFAAADFDGDGDIDLYAAQNFFAVRDEDDRFDAGRGLLLLNHGKGTFRPVPGQESGITIYGEQRAAVVADMDHDGRVDLAVAQNSGPLVVLRNRFATPGLHVRVQGPPANPDGIGTQLRLKGPGWLGPVHEVRAGSGRYGQDSMATVMGGRTRATHLVAQFPGRNAMELPMPEDAMSVTVSPNGIAIAGSGP